MPAQLQPAGELELRSAHRRGEKGKGSVIRTLPFLGGQRKKAGPRGGTWGSPGSVFPPLDFERVPFVCGAAMIMRGGGCQIKTSTEMAPVFPARTYNHLHGLWLHLEPGETLSLDNFHSPRTRRGAKANNKLRLTTFVFGSLIFRVAAPASTLAARRPITRSRGPTEKTE